PWPVRPTTAWASPPAYARERTPQRRSGTTRWRVTHMNEPHTEATNAARLRELNATIRYTMWSVFRAARPLPADRERAVTEVTELLEQLAAQDVVVRGTYDASALRADADLMVWWHSPSPDDLQDAYAQLRRTTLGEHLAPVWSVMALHRPAEFNK